MRKTPDDKVTLYVHPEGHTLMRSLDEQGVAAIMRRVLLEIWPIHGLKRQTFTEVIEVSR